MSDDEVMIDVDQVPEDFQDEDDQSSMVSDDSNQSGVSAPPQFPRVAAVDPTVSKPPLKNQFSNLINPKTKTGRADMAKIFVPAHRMTPLKRNWERIYTPIVTHLKLQIRMNTHTRHVEIKVCSNQFNKRLIDWLIGYQSSEHTPDVASLTKASDFVRAFMMGFEVDDAIALIRLDDLYIESFQIDDGLLFWFFVFECLSLTRNESIDLLLVWLDYW